MLVWGEDNNFFFAVGDVPEGNIVDGRLTCNIVDGATKSSKIAVLLSFKYAKVANSQYVASVDHDRREDRPHKHRGFEHASLNPRVVTFCCFFALFFFPLLLVSKIHVTRHHHFYQILPLLYIFVNQQVHQANKLPYSHYTIATNIAIRKTVSIHASNMASCDLQ